MHREGGKFFPVGHDAMQSVPSYAVYLLAGILNNNNRVCDVIDWVADPSMSDEELALRVSDYKLVFLSANSFSWNVAYFFAKKIHELKSSCRICIGGVHPTLYPTDVLSTKLFDAVFVGEAESKICEIYDSLLFGTKESVDGLLYNSQRKGTKCKIVTQKEDKIGAYCKDINYNMIPIGKFRSIPVETSRGCVHKCTFCATPSQNQWRSLSVEKCFSVLNKSLKYIDKSKFKRIQIIDDSFLTNHQRILDLCSMLNKTSFNKNIMYDARISDMHNIELIEALEPFTDSLLVGAEVCNDEDAKRIRKPVTPEKIEKAAKNFSKIGMADRAEFSFIIGFPWHSMKDCEKLLKYVCDLTIEYGVRIYLQWYTPTPGSSLWKELENKGVIDNKILNNPSFFFDTDFFYSYRNVRMVEASILERRITMADLCFQLRDNFTGRRKLFYVGRAPFK